MLNNEPDFNNVPKSVLIAAAKYVVLSSNYMDIAADVWKFLSIDCCNLEEV